jgi:hypothetical protein
LKTRLYLFGTSKQLKFEVEKEDIPGWYIINHGSTASDTWNIIILCCLAYTAAVVPYRTAFNVVDCQHPNTTFSIVYYTDFIVDTMYTLDLILNFFMAFEDKDKKVHVTLKAIAINYLKGWFVSCGEPDAGFAIDRE